MAPKSHHRIIELQIERLAKCYRDFLEPSENYALVDFPNHSNVGDSAIWAGEVALLQRLTGKAPQYVCDYRTYNRDELMAELPSGPILIHGGGNFGDIWLNHHEFRLRLLSDFPDRVVVQLPQSVHFTNPEWAATTARAIRAHGRFRLLVRDAYSRRVVEEMLDAEAILAPDSAFALGPMDPQSDPDYDFVAVLRTDEEVVSRSTKVIDEHPRVLRTDWIDEPSLSTLMTFAFKVHSKIGGSKSNLARFNWLADRRVARGLALLARGKVVITDRLHVHILSTLLGMPHVALDNSYGKVVGYIDAWTSDFDKLVVCSNLDQALDAGSRLLQDR